MKPILLALTILGVCTTTQFAEGAERKRNIREETALHQRPLLHESTLKTRHVVQKRERQRLRPIGEYTHKEIVVTSRENVRIEDIGYPYSEIPPDQIVFRRLFGY